MTAFLRYAAALTLLLAVAAPAPVFAFGSNDSSSSSSSSSTADLFTKAEKKVKAEQYADAIPMLEKVIKQDPKNANALNYLGYSYRKTGHPDKALGFTSRRLPSIQTTAARTNISASSILSSSSSTRPRSG
jgi:Flp pilus assembly protein TadD